MSKKIGSLVVTVFLVLLIAFAIKTESSAASKAGAYRVKYEFCVYINAYDAGSTNEPVANLVGGSGYVMALKLATGSTYAADKNGIIRVYYDYGRSCVKVNAPSLVKAGKMVKVY